MHLEGVLTPNEQCYQSQCAPEYLNNESAELSGDKYRIDIEIVVYLAANRSDYDIWEIDVYCGAYNCTRPTIFQEIANQLSVEISDLSPYPSVRPTTVQISPTTTATLVISSSLSTTIQTQTSPSKASTLVHEDLFYAWIILSHLLWLSC